MKIVLLSGGSGRRLWPMSNDTRSKQFLKILKDVDGRSISMLQRVWGQLKQASLHQQAYVCAAKAQYEIIESQVEGVPFIEEPARRDTFAAVALSVLYLHEVERCSDHEVIAFLPVDPYVDLDYFELVADLDVVLEQSGADIALMGVQPTQPTNKFGYIRVAAPWSPDRLWQYVDSFVEKPAPAVAEQLIASGSLWNCGVFCFRIGFLKHLLTRLGYPDSYRELRTLYPALPARSFDYEVLENTRNLAVARYQGDWEDLGHWGALSAKIDHPFIGSGKSVDCANTHVINELGIPLVAMGLRDVMVVSSPDGILVADKEQASALKQVIADYTDRPMVEERRWGSCRVLDYQKLADGTEVLTRFIELHPGKNLSYQKHADRTETWTFVGGRGQIVVDAKLLDVSAGDAVRIHPHEWHAVRAVDPLLFVEVQQGVELTETDIVRRFATWEEMLAHCSPVFV